MVLDHNSSSFSNNISSFYHSTRFVSTSICSQRSRGNICALFARICIRKSYFPKEGSDQNDIRKLRQYRTLGLEHRNEHSPHAYGWLDIILHPHRHWSNPNNPELAGFDRGFWNRSSGSRIPSKIDYHSTNLLRWFKLLLLYANFY